MRATTARVVGFGTTDVNATQGFGLKRKTDVPIVSQGCRGKVKGKSDATVYGCHLDREIVAGKPLLLHDTCKGDSGGPFFVQDAKGRWLLAGRHLARHGPGIDDVWRRRDVCARRRVCQVDRGSDQGVSAAALW